MGVTMTSLASTRSMTSADAVARALDAPVEIRDWQTRIAQWALLYADAPVEISFTTRLGTTTRTRQSLHMGSRITEDWAGLVWGEESKVTAGEDESAEAELLDRILGDHFRPRLLGALEGCFGLGTAALVVLIEGMNVTESGALISSDGLYVDAIDAPCVYPLKWARGRITECAFCSISDEIVDVQTHSETATGWDITNRRFKHHGASLSEVAQDEFPPVLSLTGCPPLFALIKPAIRNPVKIPYGLSVLDRARGPMELTDLAFDNTCADIDISRKMVMLPETMLDRDSDGKLIPPQRERKQLFVPLDDATGVGGSPTEFNPDMRVGDNEQAVEMGLRLLGDAVGMGANRYVYRDSSVTTARQVTSENSSLFRQRRKHIAELASALQVIGAAVLWCGRNLLGEPVDPTAEIVVKTDDSIIEDDQTLLDEGIRLYGAGLISAERFLVEYRHMTPEDAADEAAKLVTDAPPLF